MYYGEDGAMRYGKQEIEGKTYYFDTSTGELQIGKEIRTEGKWHYFKDKTGEMATGWVDLPKKRVYYGEDGAMRYGKQEIEGKTYYFDTSTGELQTGYHPIEGKNEVTVDEMVKYYNSKKKQYPSEIYTSKGAANINEFCKIYYEEAEAEGIKVEVAFCQAMKETGWLQFGGDVKASQCNFAGIGATGGGVSGATFADVRTGVRAHIQHLKAYATTSFLNNSCVDPRFKYVKRGSAPYVEWLGKNANPNGVGWAPAASYGTDIVKMMEALKS